MKLVAVAVLAVGVVSGQTTHADCCWCDPETPKAAKTTVGSDKQTYTLVFSDEFENKDRNFANGKDTKWTALDIGDTSNKGTAFYLPEQASVMHDKELGVTGLRILTENLNHTGDSPTGEKGIYMPYRSAMVQSWNKFCFTGGIVEFRARLPRGGGYWPALWAFGNLGRAVYQDSNTGCKHTYKHTQSTHNPPANIPTFFHTNIHTDVHTHAHTQRYIFIFIYL